MKWFERHLNWVVVVTGVVWNVLVIIRGVEAIVWLIIFLPIYAWAVARKKRGLAWAFFILIPLGWLSFLWLKDHRGAYGIKDEALVDMRDEMKVTEKEDKSEQASDYVGDSKTRVFHCLSCKLVGQIETEDMVWFSSIDEVKEDGYTPCKMCQ